MAKKLAVEAREASSAAVAETPQRAPQVQVDDQGVPALYANFCRVSGAPEELIVDFGLNPQPVGIPTKPIRISQRVILNHYTAKRLLNALAMSVQRHENAFGILETDVQKRLKKS